MPQVNEKVSIENHKIFSTGESFSISDLNIFHFKHPMTQLILVDLIFCGWKKISIATDLGNMNASVFNCLKIVIVFFWSLIMTQMYYNVHIIHII